MAVKDTLKFYCCTLQGLLRLKLIIGLILGLLIMLAAILTLINPVALINPFNYLRALGKTRRVWENGSQPRRNGVADALGSRDEDE